jgi:plasmid stabilization system protein ParE
LKYLLHPEAKKDLRAAAIFYSERGGSALAQVFLRNFEDAMELLQRHPRLGCLWRGRSRRIAIRHFPYSVIYDIVDTNLRVLAVAHHHRRPGYWSKRK